MSDRFRMIDDSVTLPVYEGFQENWRTEHIPFIVIGQGHCIPENVVIVSLLGIGVVAHHRQVDVKGFQVSWY